MTYLFLDIYLKFTPFSNLEKKLSIQNQFVDKSMRKKNYIKNEFENMINPVLCIWLYNNMI